MITITLALWYLEVFASTVFTVIVSATQPIPQRHRNAVIVVSGRVHRSRYNSYHQNICLWMKTQITIHSNRVDVRKRSVDSISRYYPMESKIGIVNNINVIVPSIAN